MNSLWIRTDGNSRIGLGHVIRCIAIAQIFEKVFGDIIFFITDPILSVIDVIKDSGFHVESIEHENVFLNGLSENIIVILDGYHFDTEYQKKVKCKGAFLICIDDLHDKHYVADAVINHAPGVYKSDYSSEDYTQFFLGPDYSLLRSVFLKNRVSRKGLTKIEKILICFGGSDVNNLTTTVIEVVSQYPIKNITVITGSAFPHKSVLQRFINTNPNRISHFANINAEQMLEHLSAVQLAIVPASGIMMEAIATRCIVISGYYADNQKYLYHGFLKEGVIVGCDDFREGSIRKAIDLVLPNPTRFLPGDIIDGKSGTRVRTGILNIFFKRRISCRLADFDDAFQYYEWVNEKEVRINSRNSDEVCWDTHLQWFNDCLNDERYRLFIFYLNQIPVGQVRFELKDRIWSIDYSIDKRLRGKGIGFFVLSTAINELRKESALGILALVKESNIPSTRIFEKLNFRLNEIKDGYKHFSYER